MYGCRLTADAKILTRPKSCLYPAQMCSMYRFQQKNVKNFAKISRGYATALLPSPTLTPTRKKTTSPLNTFLIIRGKRINSHVESYSPGNLQLS